MNILGFYAATFSSSLGPSSTFVGTLYECQKLALDSLFQSLKDKSERLETIGFKIVSNLAPPPLFYERVHELSELMIAMSSESFIENEDSHHMSQIDLILDAMLQPLTTALTVSTQSVVHLSKSDIAVFLLNCYAAIQKSLIKKSSTQKWTSLLDQHIKTQLTTLVSEESDYIISECGLKPSLLAVLASTTNNTLAPSPAQLVSAMQHFEKILLEPTSGSVLLMPQCDRILDASLHNLAKGKVSEQIFKSYSVLYNFALDLLMVDSQGPKYTSSSLLKPEQLQTILEIPLESSLLSSSNSINNNKT
jgi:hypothetical protein